MVGRDRPRGRDSVYNDLSVLGGSRRLNMNAQCNTCVSRFMCPNNNYRACTGYNNEDLFWALIKLNFNFADEKIDHTRKFIKSLQGQNQHEGAQ